MKSQTYDRDFLRWTEQQAALMRAGKVSELDFEHIIEEIESMGNEQKFALQSLFRQILQHLLKLQLSPATDPRAGWIEEVSEFRDQAQARMDATPSLAHYAPALFEKAWQLVQRSAQKSFSAHNERVVVPAECPFTLDQVLDIDFIPAQAAPGNRFGP